MTLGTSPFIPSAVHGLSYEAGLGGQGGGLEGVSVAVGGGGATALLRVEARLQLGLVQPNARLLHQWRDRGPTTTGVSLGDANTGLVGIRL